MENVVLVIHLILALALIIVVLLQRSEGGGLGMGGGGAMTAGRSAATAIARLTWMLAAAFIVTSLTLTIIAAQNASGSSVIDRLGVTPPPASGDGEAPLVPSLDDGLLPPPAGGDGPLVPPAQ